MTRTSVRNAPSATTSLILANIGTAVVIVPIMWRRFKALSIGYVTARVFECTFILVGIASAVSNSPNYIEADQKWIKWAHDDHVKGRISSFALVLAVFVFIYFLGALGSATFARAGVPRYARRQHQGSDTSGEGRRSFYLLLTCRSRREPMVRTPTFFPKRTTALERLARSRASWREVYRTP